MSGAPVVVAFDVQWADMDAFGHVNNARYFTWFESARIELFRRIGLATGGTPEVGPILAHTSCDYLQPVEWPARVETATHVVRLGRTSFEMAYECAVKGGDGKTPVARGKGVVVLVDYRSGRPVPINTEIRERLTEHLAE